jgi:hypothetical protein
MVNCPATPRRRCLWEGDLTPGIGKAKSYVARHDLKFAGQYVNWDPTRFVLGDPQNSGQEKRLESDTEPRLNERRPKHGSHSSITRKLSREEQSFEP